MLQTTAMQSLILTDNRVVIVGSGGELEDSGNLTIWWITLGVTGLETVI